MQVIYTIKEISKIIKNIKAQNKTIGFVPTMGSWHDGHTSLIKRSKKKTDITIASIFVNPAQFGPNEDYNEYPRDLEKDLKYAEKFNVDYIFAPDCSEIYPMVPLTNIGISKLTDIFEGKLRPGHFEGVGLILIKLFNIIKPDFAFFGQKDYQQTLVVKQIVKDLNIDIKIIVCPTIRLGNGLALSSRNKYLSTDEFKQAKILFQAIETAKNHIANRLQNRKKINAIMKKILEKNKNIKIDYAAVVMANDFSEPYNFKPLDKAVILVAVHLGKIRLIDNSLVIFPK